MKSNIMSKCHGIFFSNAGRTGNVPEFKFDKFHRPYFLDDINVIIML